MASADLSHVGPQFDDDFKVTPEVAEKVRELDLELLRLAVDGDYRSMYARVAATGQPDQRLRRGLPVRLAAPVRRPGRAAPGLRPVDR